MGEGSVTSAITSTQRSISERIGCFAAEIDFEAIPAAVRERAKLHVLDVVGTALAATHFDFAQRALSCLDVLGESGCATVIGSVDKLPVRDAVLVNGILAHGLDYDDTHTGAIVHPSSSVFPCALGMAEHLDAKGRELMVAYVLGVEVATRIGLAARGVIHARGFHTSGIAGHLGSAVAAGKLLGLDARRLAWAQGLAGSTASALCEHRADGAWNKRMHPGWAGVGGITAALLARSDFVGTRKVYEGADGLFRTHAGERFAEVDLDAMTRDLGSQWLIEQVAIKPFPFCHLLHACADSALALRRKHDLHPDDIAGVRALLHPDTFHYVAEPASMRRRPTSEYMAKFSVHYVVATCLARGKFGFAELEHAALNDTVTLSLAQRIVHDVDPDSQFPRYFSGGVVVTLRDGREFVHREKINRGAGERALVADEIVAKFMDNAELTISRDRAARICDQVLEIDRLEVRQFARGLGGECA